MQALSIVLVASILGMILSAIFRWRKILIGCIWVLFLGVTIMCIVGGAPGLVIAIFLGAPCWYTYLYSRENVKRKWDAKKKPEVKAAPPASGVFGRPIVVQGMLTGVEGDRTKITDVIIPEDVVWIGPEAFKRCAALRRVTIPAGVKLIDSSAFEGCSRLERIDFPEGLVKIGDFAFCFCGALKSVRLPASLETVGAGAFTGCKGVNIFTVAGKQTKVPFSSFPHDKVTVRTVKDAEVCRMAREKKLRVVYDGNLAPKNDTKKSSQADAGQKTAPVREETAAIQPVLKEETVSTPPPRMDTEKLMTSQFPALFLKENKEAYRSLYLQRLELMGISHDHGRKLFDFDCDVIRRHGKTYLASDGFVTTWFFGLKQPFFQSGKTKDEVLQERFFTVSELCKMIDEAEWHFWNSHEIELSAEVFQEICDWRLRGNGMEFSMRYFRMISDETGVPMETLSKLVNEQGRHLSRYKWH